MTPTHGRALVELFFSPVHLRHLSILCIRSVACRHSPAGSELWLAGLCHV